MSESLAIMKLLDERIERLSKRIEKKSQRIEEAKLLMTIPRVSYFSALTILAEIGDVSRFSDAEKLCSYAGLVPSVHQSGSARRYGRITKQGSSILRWIVQECLWVHLRYDTYISRFFFRLAWKKGKKIATAAKPQLPAPSRAPLQPRESKLRAFCRLSLSCFFASIMILCSSRRTSGQKVSRGEGKVFSAHSDHNIFCAFESFITRDVMKRKRLDSQTIERIRELRKGGVPMKEIAKRLGASVPTVYKHLKKKEGFIDKLKRKLALGKRT